VIQQENILLVTLQHVSDLIFVTWVASMMHALQFSKFQWLTHFLPRLTGVKIMSLLFKMIEQCYMLPTLFTLVNNIVEPELGATMWAAQHCSILFTSILQQLDCL
jgi:hypothetical protein